MNIWFEPYFALTLRNIYAVPKARFIKHRNDHAKHFSIDPASRRSASQENRPRLRMRHRHTTMLQNF